MTKLSVTISFSIRVKYEAPTRQISAIASFQIVWWNYNHIWTWIWKVCRKIHADDIHVVPVTCHRDFYTAVHICRVAPLDSIWKVVFKYFFLDRKATFLRCWPRHSTQCEGNALWKPLSLSYISREEQHLVANQKHRVKIVFWNHFLWKNSKIGTEITPQVKMFYLNLRNNTSLWQVVWHGTWCARHVCASDQLLLLF